MDLFIETLTGTAFELRVSPNETVMSIKSKIQRVEGIPVGQQHLIWQNDELSDHQSLRDCNIPGGSTLRLVLGLRGGPMNAYRVPTIRLTPIHFAPPHTLSILDRISSPSSAATSHVARSIVALTSTTSSNPMVTSSMATSLNVTRMAAAKCEQKPILSDPDTKKAASSIDTVTTANLETSDKTSRQKHLTFFIVKDGDSLDLRVLETNQLNEAARSSSQSCIRRPTSSDERRVRPNEKQQHQLLVNAQSLPFLQSEPSTSLEVDEESNQSKAAFIKSTTATSSSSSAAALLAGLLYAAGSCGRDSSPEGVGDEGGLSSDDERFPYMAATSNTSSYWPRPPSLEWDYGPGGAATCGEDEFPLYDDNSASPREVGCGGCLDEEDEDDDDDDSLADLEDYFLYYRTGDVLFGPSSRNSILRDSLLHGIDMPVPPKSTRTSAMKREERSSLAEKVKTIKAKLSQVKENRAQRRQRAVAGRPVEEAMTHDNKQVELSRRPSTSLEATLKQRQSSRPKDLPLHLLPPSLPNSWPFRKNLPHPLTGSIDIQRLPLPTSIASSSTSLETEDAISLAAAQQQRSPTDSLIRPRDTTPARTTGLALGTLKSRLFPPTVTVPGVSCFSRSLFSSEGSSASGGLRQRRFGTVQAPDITKISDSLFPPLFTSPPSPLTTTTSTTGSQIDSVAAERLKLAEDVNSRRWKSNRLTEEFHLPMLSPKQSPHPDLSGTSRPSTRCLNERKLSSMVIGRSRQDVSEPPSITVSSPSSNRKSPKIKNNRCASCNRKTGLANSYTCRCDQNFCARHRYAELHACPFDYKAEARRCLRESNPVITAAKLPKI